MMNNQSITKHAYVWPTRATFASSLCAAIAIDSLITRTSEQSSEVSTLSLFAPSFGINARIYFLKLISKICWHTHKTVNINVVAMWHSSICLCIIIWFCNIYIMKWHTASQYLGNLVWLLKKKWFEECGEMVEAGFVEWGLRPLYSLWFRRIFGRLRDPFGNHLCMVQLRTPQAYPHCSFPFCCACDAPYPYCLKRLICITSFKFSYIFFFYIFNTVIYCVTKLN